MKKRSENSIKSNRRRSGDIAQSDIEKVALMLTVHFGHVSVSGDFHELNCYDCSDYLNELCGGRGLIGDEVLSQCMIPNSTHGVRVIM